MEQMQVNMFLVNNQKKFDATQMPIITEQLKKMSNEEFVLLSSMNLKDPSLMLVISLFFGTFGVDRFLLGDIGMGIVKLLTLGGLGILTIIDWFSVMTKTKEQNFNTFMETLNITKNSYATIGTTPVTQNNSNNTNTSSNISKLKEYKQLFDDGIITKEEFDKKKEELL